MTGPSFLDPKPEALEAPSKQAFEIILAIKEIERIASSFPGIT